MNYGAAMQILFLSAREPTYARNEVLLHALQRLGTVTVCAPSTPRSLVADSVVTALRSLPALLTRRFDLIFVGFYGYLLLLGLRPLFRAPIIFDAFVSNYDTLAFDRNTVAPRSLRGRLAWWLDRTACRLADRVLLDTPQHADYFVETLGVARSRLDWLPVGCSDAIFTPQPLPAPGHRPTRVLAYATYLPLHGVDIILQAASLLRAEAIELHLIGNGPLYPAMRQLADDLQLSNVLFWPPVAPRQLAQAIAAADITLGGHFGASGKAQRVIPGKIYQMLAVGRPVIAADSPANRCLLHHGQSGFLIPPADPQALAAAIRTLHSDLALRETLAAEGRAVYAGCCSEQQIAGRLAAVVADVLAV